MSAAETIRELADRWSAIAGVDAGALRLIISDTVNELTARGLITPV